MLWNCCFLKSFLLVLSEQAQFICGLQVRHHHFLQLKFANTFFTAEFGEPVFSLIWINKERELHNTTRFLDPTIKYQTVVLFWFDFDSQCNIVGKHSSSLLYQTINIVIVNSLQDWLLPCLLRKYVFEWILAYSKLVYSMTTLL